MLNRICAGEASGILAWHPDRLARNSIDGGKIIYLLGTGKLLDLKFPTFWFDSTPQGKFMLNIAFGQSKYYIDNLAENIKRGHRQKLRKGIWPGFAPLGYLNNHRTKEIDLDKEKSPFIRKAFEIYATGEYTLKAVKQFLADSGISSYRKKPLSVSCVQRMLQKIRAFLKNIGSNFILKDKKFLFKGKIGWRTRANSPQFPNWRYLLVKIRTFFDENPDCEL